MYHFVFCTKYRKKLFTKEVEDSFKQIVKGIKFDFDIIDIGIDKDHVHIAVSARPKYAPSQIARIFKQLTSNRMWKKHNKYLRKFYWKKKVFWSAGYFVSTVGNVSKDIVLEYVKNQGK